MMKDRLTVVEDRDAADHLVGDLEDHEADLEADGHQAEGQDLDLPDRIFFFLRHIIYKISDMDKKTSLVLLLSAGVIIIGLILYIAFWPTPTVEPLYNTNGIEAPKDSATTTPVDETPQYKTLKITTPQSGATIASPLKVTGEAAGWYFEATFPIRLEDKKGNIIAESYVTAKEDWMTASFVPFEGEIKFIVPDGVTEGKLIFEKSNPSGLPQYEESVAIPIKFAPAKTVDVKVFFSNTQKDPNMSYCSRVYAVTRSISQTPAIARAALEELFKGPTQDEKSKGYLTSLPSGVAIQSLRVDSKTAYVDFNARLESGGSCKVAAIVSQITETLKQFDTVGKVVISINGATEGILQP